MEAVIVVIGVFFLFIAGIPLLGAAGGFFLRVVLPYLFGGGLAYLLLTNLFVRSGAWWELAIPLAAWAALVLGTRLIDSRTHAWHEGHWRAVVMVMTFGLWRSSKRPVESFKPYEYRIVGNSDK